MDNHPASNLFPMMFGEELADLAEDIKANGLLESIVLYEGMILDGRNRYAACLQQGIEPRFEDANGIGSPVLYVVSKNLHRRHLTVSQRAAIAAECVPMLKEEAKQRQGGNSRFGSVPIGNNPQNKEDKPRRSHQGRSIEIAAKEAGVGHGTVQRAIEVKRADPELHERVKAGELTVGEAARVLAGQPAKSKRREEREFAEKERMVSGLSQVRGICVGLQSLDMRKLILSAEERLMWSRTAFQVSNHLREFAKKLKGGSDGKETNE